MFRARLSLAASAQVAGWALVILTGCADDAASAGGSPGASTQTEDTGTGTDAASSANPNSGTGAGSMGDQSGPVAVAALDKALAVVDKTSQVQSSDGDLPEIRGLLQAYKQTFQKGQSDPWQEGWQRRRTHRRGLFVQGNRYGSGCHGLGLGTVQPGHAAGPEDSVSHGLQDRGDLCRRGPLWCGDQPPET